jgi:flagellin-like protein
MFEPLEPRVPYPGGWGMRGLSPIVSSVILLAATIAAGAVLYQYFMTFVEGVTAKPSVFIYNVRYVPEASRLYVTVDNSGSTAVNVSEVEVLCDNGTLAPVSVNDVVVNPGEQKVVSIVVDNCKPSLVTVSLRDNDGRTFSLGPFEVR